MVYFDQMRIYNFIRWATAPKENGVIFYEFLWVCTWSAQVSNINDTSDTIKDLQMLSTFSTSFSFWSKWPDILKDLIKSNTKNRWKGFSILEYILR